MNDEQPDVEPIDPAQPDAEERRVAQSRLDQPDTERWEAPEPTGVVAVDEALQPLSLLDTLPTSAHVEHYESVHRSLQDALADLDGS